MQSKQLRTTIGFLYELSLRQPAETLEKIRSAENGTPQTADIHTAYTEVEQHISEPWITQEKQRICRCGAFISQEILRLWSRKRCCTTGLINGRPDGIIDNTRMRAQNHKGGKGSSNESTQRRTYQRIQNNPTTDITKALQTSIQRHRRQQTLDRANGKQLKPKAFAEYLCHSMILGNPVNLSAREFTIDV